MITPGDLDTIDQQVRYADAISGYASAAGTGAMLYDELGVALGLPEDERARLVRDLGQAKAWHVLVGMVETHVHLADRAAEAQRGQPRRPDSPEIAALTYPTLPSLRMDDR